MIDENANHRSEMRISPPGRIPSTWVIPTDEESIIARHCVSLAPGSQFAAASVNVPTRPTRVREGTVCQETVRCVMGSGDGDGPADSITSKTPVSVRAQRGFLKDYNPARLKKRSRRCADPLAQVPADGHEMIGSSYSAATGNLIA